MPSRKILSLITLALLNTCLGQQVKFGFDNDPERIGEVLKDEHVSGSLVFSGG